MRAYSARAKTDPKIRSIFRAAGKKSDLKRRYGLTLKQWYDLFIAQGCLCAVCRSPHPRAKNWHTDHDHATGKVRGILCHPCNLAIGLMKDDPYLTRKLTAYLEGFHVPS